jgi:LuxR family maltose regulon positive regulatory protein
VVGSLIETKFFVPTLRRGHVSRPEPLQLLERAADARLTLVSAPAGFGKTTLLVEWSAGAPGAHRTVAWVSLDHHDRDPVVFLTYVVAALHRALPDAGDAALEFLASPPVATDAVLTTLLNELASTQDEVWLVLDDYHLVDGPEVGEAMVFLIDHLPSRVHVVIATRADPGFPLSRWRARGQLVEVRAADLRFSPGEAAAYLAESGVELTPVDLAALTARTEGWIAALQLAAVSLRGREDASEFVRRFAGNDRYVVDYLLEEVLTHQPSEVRDFLLRTSILTRLSGPLCDAVLSRSDSEDLLASLERSNLFLVPLDDQRLWFRYHQLFADVLRARLLDEQAHQVPVLHDRASRWYEEHGSLHEAIEHAVAGRSFDRAARLMEEAAPSIRRDRQDALLLGWLRQLPESTLGSSPVLAVFAGYSRMLAGDFEGAEARFEQAERVLSSAGEGEPAPWRHGVEVRTLPATIAVYRASIAQAQGDVDRTVRHARSALRLAGATDHQARGGGAGFLGLAAWARGDVAGALESFSDAVASLHAGGNVVDELTSTVILADLWVAAGRPRRARRLYEDALRVAEQHGAAVARATADLHVGLSELDVEAGNRDAAAVHLQVASDGREPLGMPEGHYRWFVARAALARAEGGFADAIGFLDRAEPLYHPGFFPDVRPIGAMRARIWIADGDLQAAADWVRERRLSPSDEAEYRREFEHLTLARLLLAAGTPHEAVGLLKRLHDDAESAGRGGSLLEIRMLQALALRAEGDVPGATARLAEALAGAPEATGYLQRFLDEGAAMAGLMRRVAEGDGAAAQVAAQLRPADRSTDPVAARSSAGVLSERELQVLRLLDTELSGPEIARSLFVSQNTLRSHTKHIFTKLDVSSRRAAVVRARERGLL